MEVISEPPNQLSAALSENVVKSGEDSLSKDEERTQETVEDKDDREPVDMTYTKELRQATKEVHKVSDVLVNAKFALALTDDAVWFDGLLAFYEIYKYLETHLPENLLPKELHRTRAFEKDFVYFYGENWKDNYKPRESVARYLDHLNEVRSKGGDMLLFAYAFQMYMALMSGGQLLQKKRMLKRKLWRGSDSLEEPTAPSDPNASPDDLQSRPMPLQVDICPDGCAATYFSEKISDLKDKLRRILNHHYPNFDEETKAAFIKESQNVFNYNIEVVRSIKGVNAATFRKISLFVLGVVGILIAYRLARH